MSKDSAENTINNDLLVVSYFLKLNAWSGANKSTYQRLLYFAAVLSPIFLSNSKWVYDFSNTIFGPHNPDIVPQLSVLRLRGYLILQSQIIRSNRIEERYLISDKGVALVENVLFKILSIAEKVDWLRVIVRTLSIYGEGFLSKLIREDPNIAQQNKINRYAKVPIESAGNLSREFFEFMKAKGKENFNIELQEDQDYLLLFFDVLYRKYKGGNDD